MRCDPFQMAMIHRTFLNEFRHISHLVRAVPARDIKRSAIVGSHCRDMISVLHHHHAAENDVLWPKLQSRAACSSEIDQMKDEHSRIDELVEKVETARSAFQESADLICAEQFAGAVDALSLCIADHFNNEERNVVPLIAEHINADEWKGFIDRGARYVKPTNLWFSLAYAGYLLRDGTPDEQRRFIGAVPLPLRVTLKLLGPLAFASYREKLR